jgi:hypothetical protein
MENRTVVDKLLHWVPMTSNVCPTPNNFLYQVPIGVYGGNNKGIVSDRPFYARSTYCESGGERHVACSRAENRLGVVLISQTVVHVQYDSLPLGKIFGQTLLRELFSASTEMMALAMNSRPGNVLQNTSAGIEQVETFRKTVSVKELKKHQRLELVFDDDMEKVDAYNDVHIDGEY